MSRLKLFDSVWAVHGINPRLTDNVIACLRVHSSINLHCKMLAHIFFNNVYEFQNYVE